MFLSHTKTYPQVRIKKTPNIKYSRGRVFIQMLNTLEVPCVRTMEITGIRNSLCP